MFVVNDCELPDICEECGLCTQGCISPLMNGDGSLYPLVLFVGEAPGANEDKQDRPFVGKSGKLLRSVINDLGLKDDEIRFTNTVRCRPPDNRSPKAEEIKACSKFLEEEIINTQPKVIVLLGNSPLKAVLGEHGITNWNGLVVERGDLTYVPAYHPAYVLRSGMNPTLLDNWLSAIIKAIEAADGKSFSTTDDKYSYHYPKTILDIGGMTENIENYCKKDDSNFVAVDVEVVDANNFNKPDNVILSIAFATDNDAWSFPIDHKDSWWSDDESDFIITHVEYLLTNFKMVGHNIRFDTKALNALLNIDFRPYGDTIRISQLINPYKGVHGLKRLSGMYLGMFDYDRELAEYVNSNPEANYAKGGHYGNIPLDILLPYGSRDVVCTHMLHDILLDELTDKQKHFYRELIMSADYALGDMELFGFRMDPYMVTRYYHAYREELNIHYDAMMEDDDVRDFYYDHGGKFNPRSPDQMNLFFFGYHKKTKDAEAYYEVEPTYKNYKAARFTNKGAPSLDKGAVSGLIENADDADKIFFDHFRLWKLLSSMLGRLATAAGYKNAWHHGDFRARSSFNIGGTKTGRLSSSRPNLQNIPTPEKEPDTLLADLPIKNIFTHTWKRRTDNDIDISTKIECAYRVVFEDEFGYIPNNIEFTRYQYVEPNPLMDDGSDGCLLFPDYSSAELRIMACIAGVQGMIDVFDKDLDPHCYVTRKVFGFSEDISDKEIKSEYKSYRYRAKWTNWTLLFGGGPGTLVATYGLSEEDSKTIVKEYYAQFPEILDFQKKTKKLLREEGYVENMFGRRLPIPDIYSNNRQIAARAERTGINMPIQSTAAEILLAALAIIHRIMIKDGYKSKFVNTVHDSIVLDVWPGELTNLMRLCKDVMENIQDYALIYYPNVDFSWLTIKMKSDMDVGIHYGTYSTKSYADLYPSGYMDYIVDKLNQVHNLRS